jgi:signal transduction histidine kinase
VPLYTFSQRQLHLGARRIASIAVNLFRAHGREVNLYAHSDVRGIRSFTTAVEQNLEKAICGSTKQCRIGPRATQIFFAGREILTDELVEGEPGSIRRRLIQAQEEERARIARELHDDINQRVALLAIELKELEEGLPESASATRDQLRRISGGLSDVASSIQALSHRLHSSKLEYLGIVSAVSSLCKELCEQHGVEIDFRSEGIVGRIPPEIALCLFRVLQEALQNALKHSGVRQFGVNLLGTSDEIQLAVSDNGRGFEEQAPTSRSGLGLISMRERIQLVNGEFSIESTPGRGTTVHARVPLKAPSSSARMKA